MTPLGSRITPTRLLVAVAFIALTALALFQHRQIRILTQPSRGQAPGPESPAVAGGLENETASGHPPSPMDSTTDSLEELRYHLGATQEELGMARDTLDLELDQQADLSKLRREAGKQQLDDPIAHRAIRDYLDSRNGAALERLNLPPGTREAFLELLFKKQQESLALFFEAVDILTPSQEQRAAYRQNAQALDATYEQRKKALLGEEDYQAYLAYERRIYNEEVVEGFAESLGSEDKLSDTQQQALTETFSEATAYLTETYRPNDLWHLLPVDQFAPETIATTLETMVRCHTYLSEAASGILSAPQRDQLEIYFQERRELKAANMTYSGLNLGYSGSSYDAGAP